MAEIVIFVGLQGAGKTTYYNQQFAATHVHVSRDVLGTAEREASRIRECFASGDSFVVDNTNATRSSRAGLIQQAKAQGFRIIGIFFDVQVRTAIGRNNHREDKRPIPVPAILRTAKHLETPAMEEGFDEVRTIKPEPSASLPKSERQ